MKVRGHDKAVRVDRVTAEYGTVVVRLAEPVDEHRYWELSDIEEIIERAPDAA